MLRRVAEIVPQRVRDVRHDRIEHAQQQREALARELDRGGVASSGTRSSAFSIFIPAETTVLYCMRS